jgi:hypothetical protein
MWELLERNQWTNKKNIARKMSIKIKTVDINVMSMYSWQSKLLRRNIEMKNKELDWESEREEGIKLVFYIAVIAIFILGALSGYAFNRLIENEKYEECQNYENWWTNNEKFENFRDKKGLGNLPWLYGKDYLSMVKRQGKPDS